MGIHCSAAVPPGCSRSLHWCSPHPQHLSVSQGLSCSEQGACCIFSLAQPTYMVMEYCVCGMQGDAGPCPGAPVYQAHG